MNNIGLSITTEPTLVTVPPLPRRYTVSVFGHASIDMTDLDILKEVYEAIGKEIEKRDD